LHAYADESARQRYLIAAVLIGTADLDRTRKALRELRKPGQRRVHFAKESDQRRRLIVSCLTGLDLRVRVYESDGPDVAARAVCLARLVDDLVALGVERLVLETLDSQQVADRRTIYERLRETGGGMAYEHRRSFEEPLLWVADAAAWCYGAGGDWRRRIKPMLD
jgi:hypothetical protein